MNASARPSNKAVRKGLAHLNAGRIDDAERLFRSVLKSEPDNPDANHALGTLAVRQGNLPLALRFLTAALQANPREARHWLSFAEALLQSGSIGDARAVIEKAAARFSGPEIAAVRLKVDHSELYQRAVEHHRAGRLAEAEPLYSAILAADPGDADSLHMIGQLAAQTGRAEVGTPLIEQAIRLKGDVAAFYCSLGNALAARGRTDEAIQAFTRALALKPDFPEAQTDLGHLYRSLGYLDEAIRLFKTAIASGANSANAHNNLGALLFNIGKLDEAIVHLTEALKQKPELAEAHNNLGNAFRETGRIDAAVRHYTTLCATSNFELVGYSEGAWVVDYWLHFHSSEARKHVKAIQLYGDPNYYKVYRHDRHGVHAYRGLSRLAGLTFGWYGPPYPNPNAGYPIKSACIFKDPVCGKGYTESLAEHALQFGTAATCTINSCHHLDYVIDGYTKRGAEFLAKYAF